MKKIVLVLDCGATNIRTVAVDEAGNLLAKSSQSNNPKPDPNYPEYQIWDIEEIWAKFAHTSQKVIKKIDKSAIAGITVTTFGVDGALVDPKGGLQYPIISWACQRTAPIMDNIQKYIPFEELYQINGVNKFSFNTINKLIWLKENNPELFNNTNRFVFISNLILYRLCGELATDITMLGTSMLTDIQSRKLSESILSKIGISPSLFPPAVEAGTVVGKTTRKCSDETGIPEHIQVVSCGHDTQFALFGSGAQINQPVLSSGTWEILMARTKSIEPNNYARSNEVTTEFDPQPGLYNSGIQWLGSGILEWIKKQFYSPEINQLTAEEVYDVMIQEAATCQADNLSVNIDFLNNKGGISGLRMHTKREEIYKATLMALGTKTKESLDVLESIGKFKATSIIVVGGGTKNKLWNQIRANVLGMPVQLLDFNETTVLGASLFAMAGAGIYNSADEARNNVKLSYHQVYPENKYI